MWHFHMQTQKQDIRRKILRIARNEFQQNGFKNTSMRSISQKAGVGLSNIYNYFRNKDEIFCEVLSGLLIALKQVSKNHNSPENINCSIFDSEEYMSKQINLFVKLVATHKKEFQLLLFQASGSSLENYREEYTCEYAKTGREYIRLMKEKYPSVNDDISDFFIYAMSSWFFTLIGKLVMQPHSPTELEKFMREYLEFGTAGWRKIMQIENESF